MDNINKPMSPSNTDRELFITSARNAAKSKGLLLLYFTKLIFWQQQFLQMNQVTLRFVFSCWFFNTYIKPKKG
jgi:hypothetical protein